MSIFERGGVLIAATWATEHRQSGRNADTFKFTTRTHNVSGF
jgi:hypothetical protein